MERTANEIEASLEVPKDTSDALQAYVHQQDQARGDWPSPREAHMPDAPWPARDNPALAFLIWKAEESVAAGMNLTAVLTQLAVHAWFEGGIENYDLGRRDAARLRSV